jgi:hypothetical protein
VPLIVRLFEPPAVTDDGEVAAHRTPARQQSQREDGHPGSILFSFSGSAIKRIKAGVKPRPERPAKAQSGYGASPSGKIRSNEKKITAFRTADVALRLRSKSKTFKTALTVTEMLLEAN